MINIAICDDMLLHQNHLQDMIVEYFQDKSQRYAIYTYSSGQQLLKDVGITDFHFIFLDIDLGSDFGVDIAKSLRLKEKKASQIVFVTSHPDYKSEVISIHTFDYLVKPIQKDKLFQVIDDLIFFLFPINCPVVSFKTIEGVVSLKIDDIIAFEYRNRKIHIITTNHAYEMYDKVKTVLSKMSVYDFISPHNAYIINLNHIKLFQKSLYQLTMSNELIVPISQLKTKEFRQAYFDFLSHKGRIL